MKTLIFQWVCIRLFLVLSLAARYLVAYTIARRWGVPIQDALIGVLLFTASWTDTQLYFHLRGNDRAHFAQKERHNDESKPQAQLPRTKAQAQLLRG